jgi:D-sedoheptulose 7-phosphate isomerase
MDEAGIRRIAAASIAVKERFFAENATLLVEVGQRITTDPSVITAIGNDMGFESVFRRQVEAHGRPGDVAIGISTSGRSPNVYEALRLARQRGLLTVGMTGGGGGRLGGLVHYLIDVPSDETPRIQEVHGMVIHILCQCVEEALVR